MKRRTFTVAALALGLALPMFSLSQAQERQGRGGDRGQGGGNFQEMRLNMTKERLAPTDEEWTVIKPRLEKVWTAQESLSGGRVGMFGGFGRGGRGGDRDRGGERQREGDRGGDRGGDRPQGPVATASRELNDLLENKDAPADPIAAKLKALREARAKARTELEAAQKELQEVLTPRQEAVLVAFRTLE